MEEKHDIVAPVFKGKQSLLIRIDKKASKAESF